MAIVPVAEVAIGLSLLFGIVPRIGAVLGVGLLAVLALALLVQRPRTNCGCMPGAEKLSLKWHVAMLAVGAGALAAVALAPARPALGSWGVILAASAAALCLLFAVTRARRAQSHRIFARTQIRMFQSLHKRRQEWTPELTLSVPSEAKDWRS